MFSYLVFVTLATIATGHVIPSGFLSLNDTAIDDERIIGGKEVVKNSYPFMVRIEGSTADGKGFLCGGTLLHQNFVVTAGHCVYSTKLAVTAITLHFGDHNIYYPDNARTTMRIPLNNVYRHDNYDGQNVYNDIALIRLPSSVLLSQYVQPICVASENTVANFQKGKTLGWGLVSDNGPISQVLKEVDLPILQHESCSMFRAFNSKTMICAGNIFGIAEAFCSGDSGGPFILNSRIPLLAGVTSFSAQKSCIAPGYGTVFTRVSAHIDWLLRYMRSDLCVV